MKETEKEDIGKSYSEYTVVKSEKIKRKMTSYRFRAIFSIIAFGSCIYLTLYYISKNEFSHIDEKLISIDVVGSIYIVTLIIEYILSIKKINNSRANTL